MVGPIQGNLNECGCYLKHNSLESDKKVLLKGKDGKEALFSIDSFHAMSMRDRIDATVSGTNAGEFIGNRFGIILIPGRIYNNKDLIRVSTPANFLSRGTSEFPLVSEASVGIGSSGFWKASKDAGYSSSFVHDKSATLIIIIVRCLAVTRPD